jgi:hypothetical protein
MSPPKVFLETTPLKFASERVIRSYRIQRKVRWGHTELVVPLQRWYEEFPIEERLGWRRHWRQRLEIQCLPIVAWLAKEGRLTLLSTRAVELELSGLPRIDDLTGLFYGAPITWVQAPVRRESAFTWLFGPFKEEDGKRRPLNARERQIHFLSSVRLPRFLELQKVTGAYRPVGQAPPPNQMLDAFHLWSAEYAGANYFLTLDRKLAQQCQNARDPPRVQCVTPRQLLTALGKIDPMTWRDQLRYLGYFFRQVRYRRKDHPLEALVDMSRAFDQADAEEERRTRGNWWMRPRR